MNVEAELNSILELEHTARVMMKQVAGLRSSYSIAAPATDQEFISHSRGTDPIGKYIAAIDEAERKLDAVIDQLVDKKRTMSDLINRLPDHRERLFLTERYIACMDTQAIAKENEVGRRWVNDVLRAGREHLQEISEEKSFTSPNFPKPPTNVS